MENKNIKTKNPRWLGFELIKKREIEKNRNIAIDYCFQLYFREVYLAGERTRLVYCEVEWLCRPHPKMLSSVSAVIWAMQKSLQLL